MGVQSRKRVFLGLGSNLGDRVGYLEGAVCLLKEVGEVICVSTVYESPPWGVENQPAFLNCVAEVRTSLDPFELLRWAKSAERRIGRKERFRWGPREIDIDILLFGEEIIDSRELSIPHRFLEEREFFLIPLLEIEPCIKNPRTGVLLSKSLPKNPINLKPFCCLLSGHLHGT